MTFFYPETSWFLRRAGDVIIIRCGGQRRQLLEEPAAVNPPFYAAITLNFMDFSLVADLLGNPLIRYHPLENISPTFATNLFISVLYPINKYC